MGAGTGAAAAAPPSAAAAPPKAREPLLIDIIATVWFKAIRILAMVIKAVTKLKHKTHISHDVLAIWLRKYSNLNIVGPVLQNMGAVGDGPLEVGNLFIACSSVSEALERKFR